ncbi:Protein kinase, ATP binding site [Metarhizium robertsii ARSEF 23]|uniref:non-specific serine/threonine protein kinase n=1 Tax=Metarhizium robertsii (strain ARSEF 23 / ATCC MYA-3075) TaxID=655844 RepID=E9F346_METRA|nr:Protein kinase, ATP binding site [Metarhizium robertsii ARSEF 23]EFY97912.1 Protein kinase, ATP binding site [Metarhizium robertsii ARSEF 23]
MWTLVVLSNAVAFSSLTWLFLTIHGFLTASVMNPPWFRNLRRPVLRTTARLFKLHQRVFLSSKSTPVSTTASPDSPVLLPASTPIEEEELPGYVAEDYYPTRIGQVFESQYRVLCKLGRGTGSTVWLAKDLCHEQYRVLKVCTLAKNSIVLQQAQNEIAVLDYLKSSPVQQHPGKAFIRTILTSFEVSGPKGSHQFLVYQPLGMTFTELRNLLPERRIETRMLQHALQILLVALDYLHKNNVVHTDISPNNILCGVKNLSPFEELEEAERAQPVARKVLRDRVIYLSRQTPMTQGEPVLSDLGSARFGQEEYQGDIMPLVYRAPEVILDMKWSSKVDIWSMGVMVWDLLEGRRLFVANRDGLVDDEQHLAEMVSLMGPPPREFLQRSKKCAAYFDDSGNWLGSIPIPTTSLEERVTRLEGEDKQLMLSFARRALRWLPEERHTAEELAFDDWLMQPYSESKDPEKGLDSEG